MAQLTKESVDNAKIVRMMASSAHQIWLAGLGALSKAQAEGTKLFDSLVKEGEAAQERAAKSAGGQIAQLTRTASDAWDRFEHVVEGRVSKTLNKVGVPSYGDIQKLTRHVDVLNASVQGLMKSARPARKRAPAKESRSA